MYLVLSVVYSRMGIDLRKPKLHVGPPNKYASIVPFEPT